VHGAFLSYLVVGIVIGCLYALTASGLVVTYTTSGIFNFAHGAIGMFMAFTYWQLAVGWHVPVPIALLLTLFVLAPLMGALVERIFIRPLYGASLGVTLVVTLGLLLLLLGVANAVWSPTVTRNLPPILMGHQVTIFGVVVSFYQLMVLVVSVAVAVVLRVLFTRTRVGITMRAVVDDRELTAMAGTSPHRTAQLSWALGASMAALAGILIAPLEHLDQLNLTLLVVTGYAAAVVGRLRSVPLTVLGAMLLGLLNSYAVGYLPSNWLSDLQPVLPMAVLFIMLLVMRPGRLAAGRVTGRITARIPSAQQSLLASALFVAAAVVASRLLSPSNLITAGAGLVIGLIALSLVLLTGFSGQVSLCQMTFAGAGAFVMGKTFGGSSIFGLVLAVIVPAAVGGLLAAAVLRLRGLYLALATLAFAYAADSLFFNHFLGFGGILKVGRVRIGLPTTQRGYFVLIAVVFAAVAAGLMALRRGPVGRLLAAMNDSEVACASVGLNITWVKILVFTLSAGIAGLGGAFYGGWQHEVGPNDFYFLFSLILLLLITIAGIDTVTGAFAAAIFYALQPQIARWVPIVSINYILVGVGAAMLGRNTGGVIGQMSAQREWLRARLGRGPTTEPLAVLDDGRDVAGALS